MDKEKSENKQTNKQKQQNKIKKTPKFPFLVHIIRAPEWGLLFYFWSCNILHYTGYYYLIWSSRITEAGIITPALDNHSIKSSQSSLLKIAWFAF